MLLPPSQILSNVMPGKLFLDDGVPNEILPGVQVSSDKMWTKYCPISSKSHPNHDLRYINIMVGWVSLLDHSKNST